MAGLLLNGFKGVTLGDASAVLLADILRELGNPVVNDVNILLNAAPKIQSDVKSFSCLRRLHLIGFIREEIMASIEAEWTGCPKL